MQTSPPSDDEVLASDKSEQTHNFHAKARAAEQETQNDKRVTRAEAARGQLLGGDKYAP